MKVWLTDHLTLSTSKWPDPALTLDTWPKKHSKEFRKVDRGTRRQNKLHQYAAGMVGLSALSQKRCAFSSLWHKLLPLSVPSAAATGLYWPPTGHILHLLWDRGADSYHFPFCFQAFRQEDLIHLSSRISKVYFSIFTKCFFLPQLFSDPLNLPTHTM